MFNLKVKTSLASDKNQILYNQKNSIWKPATKSLLQTTSMLRIGVCLKERKIAIKKF